MDSERWTEAVQIRRAFDEGIAGARHERAMHDRMMSGDVGAVG